MSDQGLPQHRGVAPDHPLNRLVLARMRPSPRLAPEERAAALAVLERQAAAHPGPPPEPLRRRLALIRGDEADRTEERPLDEPAAGTNRLALGTHPDIVDRLWAIGRSLPVDASRVCYRQPVLAHPVSGVIFGLGVGTLGYGLRLPEVPERALDLQTKTYRGLAGPKTFDWSEYGTGWFFGDWSEADVADARRAYEAFAEPWP